MSQGNRGFEEALADAVRGEITLKGRGTGPHALVSGSGTSVLVTGGTVVIGAAPEELRHRSLDAAAIVVIGLASGAAISAGVLYAWRFFA